MPWYVIRQHQHWRAAVPDEVTRHAVQEIGLHCVQVVQVFLDRLHRYVGPPLHEVGHPVLLAMAVHDGRVLTRGSPRRQAISVRSSVSPSIASVLARRWRRGTAIDAGSTTWLSTPLASSKR